MTSLRIFCCDEILKPWRACHLWLRYIFYIDLVLCYSTAARTILMYIEFSLIYGLLLLFWCVWSSFQSMACLCYSGVFGVYFHLWLRNIFYIDLELCVILLCMECILLCMECILLCKECIFIYGLGALSAI